MARPPKSGLEYFPLDTDFFSDRKIRRARRVFGDKSVMVFQYLLCEIYREKGYYVVFEDSLLIDVANEFGYTENLVKDIILFCANAELFDIRLLEQYGILTSEGIQRRYVEIIKQLQRIPIPMFDSYLLISPEELPTQKFSIVPLTDNNTENGSLIVSTVPNGVSIGGNEVSMVGNATKEIKVKEIKLNTTAADAADAHARTCARSPGVFAAASAAADSTQKFFSGMNTPATSDGLFPEASKGSPVNAPVGRFPEGSPVNAPVGRFPEGSP